MPKENIEKQSNVGRVNDEEAARRMAEIEDPYRKKRWGIFSPSKYSVIKGEAKAETFREKGYEIPPEKIPHEVRKILDDYKAEWLSKGSDRNLGDYEFKYSYIEPLGGETGRHYRIECWYKGKQAGNSKVGYFPGFLAFDAVVTVGKDGKVDYHRYRGGYRKERELPASEK